MRGGGHAAAGQYPVHWCRVLWRGAALTLRIFSPQQNVVKIDFAEVLSPPLVTDIDGARLLVATIECAIADAERER